MFAPHPDYARAPQVQLELLEAMAAREDGQFVACVRQLDGRVEVARLKVRAQINELRRDLESIDLGYYGVFMDRATAATFILLITDQPKGAA